MIVGLDTSALIDFIQEKSAVTELIKTYPLVVIQTLVSMEFCAGTHNSTFLSKILMSFHSHDFLSADLLRGYELFLDLRKKGIEIGIIDCCIAATYLNNDVNTIITKNTKHFSRIPGLKVISY